MCRNGGKWVPLVDCTVLKKREARGSEGKRGKKYLVHLAKIRGS